MEAWLQTVRRQPFHCIKAVKKNAHLDHDILIAACGDRQYSLDLATGSHTLFGELSNPQAGDETADNEPAAKRRKIVSSAESPKIIKLAPTPDQQHLVAVTDVDKCVRVFRISPSGPHEELSQRCMPKRPCALLVMPDNQTILCGDKFGDVYGLPLQPPSVDVDQTTPTNGHPAPVKKSGPSATPLTVHTQRNLKALEHQRKQLEKNASPKEPLAFQHSLLLGHVSMLTDIALAGEGHDGRRRNYIITADRDEHIRISRGPPQSHIIERYCLGHTAFVNKLCVLSHESTLLSAGGDDWMGVWDWQSGRLISKRSLTTVLTIQSLWPRSDAAQQRRVAVTGLWTLSGRTDEGQSQSVVLVSFESTPAILLFIGSQVHNVDMAPTMVDTTEWGLLLDVAETSSGVIMSLLAPEYKPRLRSFDIVVSGETVALKEGTLTPQLAGLQSIQQPVDHNHLKTLLSSVENLRKHEQEEDGIAEDA